MFVVLIVLLGIVWGTPVWADDFILTKDGAVADLTSGLLWQGNSQEAGSASRAAEYCQNLRSVRGYSWRLPTRTELAELDVHLQSTSLNPYWVTERNTRDQGIYCLGDGAFFPAETVNIPALVRCVAQNPLAPVLEAVRSWASSWQNRDVDGYLSAYVPDFTPRNGQAHDVWRQQRRHRLQAALDIRIRLQTEKIHLLDKHLAEVVVLQSYRSRHYQDLVRKRLLLSQVQGRWLIAREDQLATLPLKTLSTTASY